LGTVQDEHMGDLQVEGDEAFLAGEMVVQIVLLGKLA